MQWQLALALSGALLGTLASATHLDSVIAAVGVYTLGFVWLPAIAFLGLYAAYRGACVWSVLAFSVSGAFANYVVNLVHLEPQLRANSWVYALAVLLVAVPLSAIVLRLSIRAAV